MLKKRLDRYLAEYAHQDQLTFLATMRSANQLAQWVGEHLGLDEEKATLYAHQIVEDALIVPPLEDFKKRLHEDLQAAGVDISSHRLNREYQKLLSQTNTQMVVAEKLDQHP